MKIGYFTVFLALALVGSVFAEDGEKTPKTPPRKFLVLGGRWVSLNDNDGKLIQLVDRGEIPEAGKFVLDHWKNLESCMGLRAIEGDSRRKLLKELTKLGFVHYDNSWDRFEVLITDPLGHFSGLLPDLKIEELSNTPVDQVIPLFKHPDFPKAWLADEVCAWLAFGVIKANDENEEVLLEILQCGVPASSIVKTQTGFSNTPLQVILMKQSPSDKTMRYLLKNGLLELKDPSEREVVFGVLIKTDDEELWAAASRQQLQWSTKLDRYGHFVESVPDSLKDFSGWLKLHKHLGLDLHHPKLFRMILWYPVLKQDTAPAKEFLLGRGKQIIDQLMDAGRNVMAEADTSWIPLLMQMGLDPKARDKQGNTLLHQGKNCDRLKVYLDVGLDPNAQNKEGSNCLFVDRFEKELEFLLNAGAKAGTQNQLGENALFYQQYAKSIAVLLKAGADPNLISRKGETLWSRLDFNFSIPDNYKVEIDGEPLKEPLMETVDVLLKGKCKQELADGHGVRPLMLMARKGRPLLLLKLLATGADKNAVDHEGHNALDSALTFSKWDPRFLNPAQRIFEVDDGLSRERMAVCMWLLKDARVQPSIKATSPLINPEAWQDWLKLKDARSLPDEYLRVALRYDDPVLTHKLITNTPHGLNLCIEACAWVSAKEMLDRNPGMARQDPKIINQCLMVLKQKEASTFTGGCVRSVGRRQDEFEALYGKLRSLMP